jgi:hypothetical protein
MHKAPVGALACHCIELSLKAVLLNRGYTSEQVVDFRHNLNKLFNETRHAGLDWSDLDTKAIAFYAQAVREQAFRYRNSARPYVFDDQKILTFTETIFRRCAQALGAQRSLKPRPRRRGIFSRRSDVTSSVRPTGLGAGIDKDRQDFTIYSGGWASLALILPIAGK